MRARVQSTQGHLATHTITSSLAVCVCVSACVFLCIPLSLAGCCVQEVVEHLRHESTAATRAAKAYLEKAARTYPAETAQVCTSVESETRAAASFLCVRLLMLLFCSQVLAVAASWLAHHNPFAAVACIPLPPPQSPAISRMTRFTRSK